MEEKLKDVDLGSFEVETADKAVAKRLAEIEAKRKHTHLGVPVIRFYQADDASEAPGAWYAAFHNADRQDVKLHDTDSKFMHDLAERLLGKKP